VAKGFGRLEKVEYERLQHVEIGFCEALEQQSHLNSLCCSCGRTISTRHACKNVSVRMYDLTPYESEYVVVYRL
jgi:hypothetical protein